MNKKLKTKLCFLARKALRLSTRFHNRIRWFLSDERKNPYRCDTCGSTGIQIKAWGDPIMGTPISQIWKTPNVGAKDVRNIPKWSIRTNSSNGQTSGGRTLRSQKKLQPSVDLILMGNNSMKLPTSVTSGGKSNRRKVKF